MRFRTTLELLVAVVVVALIILVTERRPTGPSAQRAAGGALMALRIEDVTRVTFQEGTNRLDFVKQGADWFIRAPFRARTADGAVERLLGGLEALGREEVVTERQRQDRGLSLAEYSLDPPVSRLTVTDSSGAYELGIGCRAPLGRRVYVRVSGSPDVVATSGDLLDLLPRSAADWRDRRLIAGDVTRVNRVDLRRPSEAFIRLVRLNGEWSFQQPFSAPADSGRVGAVIEKLLECDIAGFVWDPPGEGASGDAAIPPAGDAAIPERAEAAPGDWGVAEDSAISVEVWMEGDMAGRQVAFGRPVPGSTNLVYARAGGADSVVTVPGAVVSALSFGLDEFRNRQVVRLAPETVNRISFERSGQRATLQKEGDEWRLTEPVPARADRRTVESMLACMTAWRAESVISGEATNEVASEMALPWCRIVLGMKTGAAPAAASAAGEAVTMERVLRVVRPEDPRLRAAVRFEDEDVVYRMGEGALGCIPAEPTDPSVFRDRAVLALNPQDIRRITLQRPGGEQSVWREDLGAWTTAAGSNAVDRVALARILQLAADLRAEKIETDGVGVGESFGLGENAVSVTFGLSGKQGIQKSLRLGYRARTEGVYASIQGQDTVYVISREAADLLMKGLILPEPGVSAP